MDHLCPCRSFASKYAIRNNQENQNRLELSVVHQFLFCTNDVNGMGEDINTMKEETEF
jgi:hypothetical protein